VFTEPDEVFGSGRRSTKRLRKYLGERAELQAVTQVPKEEGVSESLVRRCSTEGTASELGVDEGNPKASRVIRLGEFSVKRRSFCTIPLKHRRKMPKVKSAYLGL
jgi:hypothetical protein